MAFMRKRAVVEAADLGTLTPEDRRRGSCGRPKIRHP